LSLRRPVGLLALIAMATGSLTALTAPAAVAASPDLVISQVYGGGGNASAPYTHDFVELFNRSAAPVSTSELSVQYASATGTGSFAPTALPAASVPAGGYFLVQLAGGTTGSALPQPDATGTLNLSGIAGKVALATGTTTLGCNGGSSPCSTEQLARVVDLVGYGGANFYEGSSAAPGLSNTTAALRGSAGCTDTDQNGADVTAGPPAPRSSATTPAPCGAVTDPDPDPEPEVTHGAVQRVSAVQGSGAASPLAGRRVTVEAVVTALTTSDDSLSGYYLQEQDADQDGDPATSEGLEVLCAAACPAGLKVGDLVKATGVVGERFAMTRLDASGKDALSTVEASGLARPTPATITLPAVDTLRAQDLFESTEGMLTTVTTPLVVTEFFNLAQFGEVVLAPSRAYQFSHASAPGAAGFAAHQAELAKSRLVLDDDNDDRNDATSGPDSNEPYPYPSGGLSVDNRFRGGDTIQQLTGVLQYGFGTWRMRPADSETYTFTATNARTQAPEDVGGRLTVASFNVLNYFRTIDTTSSNSTGPCGPSGTMDCRGADSEAELERQRAKIVAALTAMDPDIAGLIEIQNDDDVALAHLVEGLNAATAPGTYDYLRTGTIGSDAIKLAFVYKPATVETVGAHAVLDRSVDVRFEDNRSRPALAQTFREKASGEAVTVSVNHFKSKGSACGDADPDKNDGAGNCDLTRTRAAQALGDWLAADPTGSGDPDVLVIGDLNAYKREAPVSALKSRGYTDLIERFGGEKAYGYLFDGQLGYLDHALANQALAPQVTGATEWHINADEIQLLDYNDTVHDTGEAAFERKSTARELYAPDAYRSSDHDPVVVGLALVNSPPSADAGGPYQTRVGRAVQLDASASRDPEGGPLTFHWDLDADGRFDDATGPRPVFSGDVPPGRHPVSVRVSDGKAGSVAHTVVTVTTPGTKAPPGRP
jgi:uncharacterized protein